VHGVVLTVGCSSASASRPDHVTSVVGLLRCADVALYSAKATRGTYALYDRRTDQHSAALLGLQADLRAALEQPGRHADLRRLPAPARPAHRPASAVECLVRWKHPVLGELYPDSFIPMAESTSLIDLLMRRVLDLALSQLAEWDRRASRSPSR
jgi:predicted signal transduction protein with EAL and GGDEF domain